MDKIIKEKWNSYWTKNMNKTKLKVKKQLTKKMFYFLKHCYKERFTNWFIFFGVVVVKVLCSTL